ncbi:hypothetical protein BSZ36_14100 [Rubricoccus marinus]|uniref:Uncharacterized protein n=2 Tax=Rubricoccus marinus TaxID=716817 RepID=A0A259U2I1_9BACT|nr:hypothetical protein BSZ36_14100 [Rubricoccus marinus]
MKAQAYGHKSGQYDNSHTVYGGLSIRSLCQRCNNRLGVQVGTEFSEFAKRVRRSGKLVTAGSRAYVEAENVYPQRIARQFYLTFLSLCRPGRTESNDAIREFVRYGEEPLPSDAPRPSLYLNKSNTYRAASFASMFSANGKGWAWAGCEFAFPGLGVIMTLPEEEMRGRAPLSLIGETVDVREWAEYGFKERATVRLELPVFRVEHPHPLAFGKERQAERWQEEQGIVWMLGAEDESDELLKASGSVLWHAG